MGTHCSSELYRGHIFKSKTTTMKLLLLTALAAVAMAEPEAEAGYYGYHPGFYGYYGHQLNWPAYSAPGFSSHALDAAARDQLRLMLNLDITDILMDIMDTPMPMVMVMLPPDTATLMSAVS